VTSTVKYSNSSSLITQYFSCITKELIIAIEAKLQYIIEHSFKIENCEARNTCQIFNVK